MRAVLVFCEGNHDIAFVRRSLGALAGATFNTRRIRDLPPPFGPKLDPKNPGRPILQSLIAERYRRYRLEDLHLTAAAHAEVPIFEATVEIPGGPSYWLVRCGGDESAARIRALVTDIWEQMQFVLSDKRAVHQIALAFLFDADEGLDARERRFARDYVPHLVRNETTHGRWDVGVYGPVGLFVFHDPSTRAGTLEDTLAPMVQSEWPARWNAAGSYLTTDADPDDPVSKKPSERLKAQITIVGQHRLPGDPMSQVIGERSRGLPRERFVGSDAARALVDFLSAVPWP